MNNLAKLEFVALDISGKNYLSWVLDAEIHLDANGLGDTIKDGNKTSIQDKAKAMIFLRRHLHEGLKNEYLTVKDPCDLWKNLKERYNHQKTVILPKARYDWMHLRLQDFKSVSEYNSALFKISSQLKLCGEKVTEVDMLEKTYSTFHATNVLLQQQYREKGFTKYSQLISCLLVAEQNNELLMKNHESRPTGSNPFPEANVITHTNENNRGRGRGRGRGRRPTRQPYHGRPSYSGRGHMTRLPQNSFGNKKWHNNNEKTSRANDKSVENICFRCGGKDHWSRTCRTPKHLIDLYQESMKIRGKRVETNFASEMGEINHGQFDVTHLDVADFFVNPEKKTNEDGAI